MPTKKEIWAQWDDAWELNRTTEERRAILKAATTPDFKYTNPAVEVSGNLDQLVEVIEKVLKDTGNKLRVKHITWHEHHDHSALQWDMMDVQSNKAVLPGWSYGRYAEDGKLLSVTDFFN